MDTKSLDRHVDTIETSFSHATTSVKIQPITLPDPRDDDIFEEKPLVVTSTPQPPNQSGGKW